MRLFLVNHAEFIVAADEADAVATWRAYMRDVVGENPDDHPHPEAVALPGDKFITITREVARDGQVVGEREDTLTAGEWARAYPRGWLASTEQ